MNTTIEHISRVIATAERCKNAYHWTPSQSAGGRRSNEARNTIAPVTIAAGHDTWVIGFDYRETCRNVYASGHYYRNGKKTTLTAVKNLLKRMQ